MAARQAGIEAVVETVDALLRHQLFQGPGVGIDDPDGALVAPLQLLQQLVGLLVEAARIDAEYVDFRHVRPDDVGQHHGLGAEAVRIDDPAVLAHRAKQLFPRRHRLLLELEV